VVGARYLVTLNWLEAVVRAAINSPVSLTVIRMGVEVGVGVVVCVGVGLDVLVGVEVAVGVGVDVLVGVVVAVGVALEVLVAVGVTVGLAVFVNVGVGVAELAQELRKISGTCTK
jgi:hypothetical protein